jgi:hypothetical protein
MKIFDKHQFLALAKLTQYPVVSIYIPTSRWSNDGYQADLTHFKNTLSQVEKELIQNADFTEKEAIEFLKKPSALLDDFSFWQHNSDLLACFITPNDFQTLKLPIDQKCPFIHDKFTALPYAADGRIEWEWSLLFIAFKP